jgi:anti-sigma-K factor RskA
MKVRAFAEKARKMTRVAQECEGRVGMKVGWRWAAVASAVAAAMFAGLDSDKSVQTMGLVLFLMLWVGCLVEMVCEAIRERWKAEVDK